MKQTVILGNIVTMDEKRPTAKAALVKNGVFTYIGDADTAKQLGGANAKILDYGESFIYPGFLESHTHGAFAGYRSIGQANLTVVMPPDYKKYPEVIKEFIKNNPQREVYLAAGWGETGEYISRTYLDDICADKPLIMHSAGGHSLLLNTKALEWAGIDAKYAKEVGYDLVHVDENGEPDGYVCEMPVLRILNMIPNSFEDLKNYILDWQDFIIAKGFTAVADAGAELLFPEASRAYHELEQEGKLKLRTYSYLLAPDNVESPKAEVARIAADRAKYSEEYYHVIGIKAFLDGVTEAHTGWQNQDYADQPGYHGVERFNDHDKMVELIVEADKEGLSVHVHSEGGGATHFMLGCIEDAEKITGDMDQRNILAHLHFVTDEDIRRMASTRSVPAVAPLWTAKIPAFFEQEAKYVGEELANQSYPIKSFFDTGSVPVFHSDYPVSPMVDVGLSIYMAEFRALPQEEYGGMATQGNPSECITREQALRAMTVNVAYQWRQENRMGSIECGKLANMTVFDCDLLHDDAQKVANAKVKATIIDGEVAYSR